MSWIERFFVMGLGWALLAGPFGCAAKPSDAPTHEPPAVDISTQNAAANCVEGSCGGAKPAAEPPGEAQHEADTAVEGVATYPDMTPSGGTYRLMKAYTVHQAADVGSTKLTELHPGLLVNFKYVYRDWFLIDWPAGPGELRPGWIQVVASKPSATTPVGPLP